MDPLTLSALVSGGGKLLEALFSPSEKSKAKAQVEAQVAGAKDLGAWRANQITRALKPEGEYYQSGNLPALGASSYNAVMGNLMNRLGPEMLSKWGINYTPNAMPAAAGPVTHVPPTTTGAQQQDRFGGRDPAQDLLLRRYLG